ncbi:head GIN domain-containing protein [soil metagenome]
MKRLFTILLCLITAAGFSQTINDPNAQVRTVSEFNSIEVSGAIDLYISQGNDVAVAVSAADENLRSKIKTEVRNGTLRIYFDDHSKWSWGNKKLTAYVSFKTLKALDVSGASSCKINGVLNLNDLNVKLTGASSLVGAVKLTTLNLEGSGASNIKISGTVTNANINCSGASDVKSYDLITDVCVAKISGASDINITVNGKLSVTASGASSLKYKGSAVIQELNSSGASSVSKKS